MWTMWENFRTSKFGQAVAAGDVIVTLIFSAGVLVILSTIIKLCKKILWNAKLNKNQFTKLDMRRMCEDVTALYALGALASVTTQTSILPRIKSVGPNHLEFYIDSININDENLSMLAEIHVNNEKFTIVFFNGDNRLAEYDAQDALCYSEDDLFYGCFVLLEYWLKKIRYCADKEER